MVTKKLLLTLAVPTLMMASNGACCGSSTPSSTSTPSDTTTTEETEDQPQEEEAALKIEDINLNGVGDNATNFIDLEAGLSLFEMSHTGSSNFIVQLKSKETGNLIELLVNEIGSYKGTTFAPIPSKGKYLLEIQADGQWSAVVKQPRDKATQTLPYQTEGTGDTVLPVKLSNGLVVMEMTHSGSSNFIVQVIHDDGSSGNLAFNEIGQYDGSKSITVYGEGTYYVAIQADGKWTLKME